MKTAEQKAKQAARAKARRAAAQTPAPVTKDERIASAAARMVNELKAKGFTFAQRPISPASAFSTFGHDENGNLIILNPKP